MLGDGIVSFGVRSGAVCRTVSCRNENASPKIVSPSVTRSCTFSAADSKSRSPSALRKCTCIVSSALLSMPCSW